MSRNVAINSASLPFIRSRSGCSATKVVGSPQGPMNLRRRSIGIMLVALALLVGACSDEKYSNNGRPHDPSTTLDTPGMLFERDSEELQTVLGFVGNVELAEARSTSVSQEEAIQRVVEYWDDMPAGRYGKPEDSFLVSKLVIREESYHQQVGRRLCWLVLAPMGFRLTGCGPAGLEGGTLASCWVGLHWEFIDAETGDLLSGNESGIQGPHVTASQMEVLMEYQAANGGWALWDVVKGYNGAPIPPGLINELVGSN